MVGFKTVWTLLILLVFAACVPQTKSTSCKSTEAFSSTLRKCIPLTQGPEAFIRIKDYLPTSPLVKYKNDVIPVTLQINYDKLGESAGTSIIVEWIRVYNGTSTTVIASSNTQNDSSGSSSYVFAPSYLGNVLNEVGIHSFQAKLKMANGTVLDSQNFQVTINELPRPVIRTATINPAAYHSEPTPLASTMTFEFITDNNNAIMAGAGYRTDWKLSKNGVPQGIVDSDTHSNTVQGTGASAQNLSAYDFEPSIWGIGSYIIRAQVTNFAAEIVAEQQWSVTVKHPNLSVAQSQPIYANGLGPAYNAITTAYSGQNYNQSPTLNFVPVGQSTQGQYCVNFADGNGVYNDSAYIRVDYYIDGTQLVYSGLTGPADNQVCLTEGGAGVLAGVVFNNASPTVTQTHTITARAFDVSTNQEYSSTSVGTGLPYPFKWTFNVKPVNLPPTLAFVADSMMTGITCSPTATPIKNCNVTQGQSFRVGINATDDFYNTATDLSHFSYAITLNRGSVPVSSCTKAFTDTTPTTTPPTDFVGPDFLCDFTVPTFDANGSIHPTADIWSVTVNFSDNGSTVSGSSPAASAVYTYALQVAEFSTAPTIAAQGLVTPSSSYLTVDNAPGANTSAGNTTDPLDNAASASFVTEGDTLRFNVRVADAEMDDYKVTIELCTDFTASCTTTANIVPQVTVPKTDNAATQLTSYTYLIPENLVPITSPLTADVDVFFKVTVADAPDTLAGVSTSAIMSTNVRNKNPAPVVNTAAQVPALTGPHNVVVGYPFSIDPGTVTDPSLAPTEANLSYQWYVSTDNSTFAAIAGATTRILTWTPSSAYGATAYLKMCASDGTTIHPVSSNFASVCTGTRASSSYQINIKSNITTPNLAGVIGTTQASAGAVWHDTSAGNTNIAYVASVEASGGDYFINVAKMVKETTGPGVDTWNTTFQNVRFKAISAVTAALPTDLSIAGTADSLYVAYKCAPSAYPTSARACIRRIEKSFTASTVEKTNLIHKGKFGFAYSGHSLSYTGSGLSTTIAAPGGENQVTFTNSVTAGSQVVVNGVTFTADSDGTIDPNEFCSSATPGCTDASAAIGFRNLINQSTNAALQGVTARYTSAGDVFIGGMKNNDWRDSSEFVGGLGKIVVTGASVQLPVINQSLASPNENRITILYTTADAHLGSTALSNHPLLTTDKALSLSTGVDDNGRLVIGLVSAEASRAGQGRLYHVAMSGSIFAGTVTPLSTSLFGGVGLSHLKIAPSIGSNAFDYVVAYDTTNFKWKLGRHDEITLALSNTSVQNMEDLTVNPGTGADDVVIAGEVQDIEVIADPAINGEARLAVSNFGSTVLPGFYLLRWKTNNELSCPSDAIVGVCAPFSTFTTDVDSRVFLSAAPQLNAIAGAAGYTASENNKTVVHALGFTAAAASPRHMVLNIVPESIKGDDTANPTGTSGWQAPYVK